MTVCLCRRAIAIALLILTPASAAEAVFGMLRDGAVHHESAVAAAASRDAGPQSGHGREDSAPTHQRGTPADHCTHEHGTATVSPVFSFSFSTSVSAHRLTACTIHPSRILLEEFEPPRA